MSDDASIQQQTRDAALALLQGAIEKLGGVKPTELPVGLIQNPRECVVARVFNAALPQPVVVMVERIFIASESDARLVHAAWGSTLACLAVDAVGDDYIEMFEGLPCIYSVDLPPQVSTFIEAFDNGVYSDLMDSSVGGSGDGGTGGINAELGGSEASPAMFGGSEAGGGA